MKGRFRTLRSVPFISLSLLTPVLRSLDADSFVVSFEFRKPESSRGLFISEMILAILGSWSMCMNLGSAPQFIFFMIFIFWPSIYTKKPAGILIGTALAP